MATKTLLTVEDFIRLPDRPDSKSELVEGEVVEMSPTPPLHNLVRDAVLVALKNFLRGRDLGIAVSEQAFILSSETVRIPDVAFVSKGRFEDLTKLPERAPELAVEVVSPSNTLPEIYRRLSDYFDAGAKRVWVVYPEHREVYIHGLAGVTRRGAEDALEDPELLPGFSLKVSSLFE